MASPLNVLAQEGEPALNTSRAVAVVTAIIAFVVAFGLDLSKEQIAATLGLVVVVVPLVQGYITRAKVFSPKTVAEDFTPNAAVAVELTSAGALVAGDALPDVKNGEDVAVIDTDDLPDDLTKVGDLTVAHSGGVLIPGNVTRGTREPKPVLDPELS